MCVCVCVHIFLCSQDCDKKMVCSYSECPGQSSSGDSWYEITDKTSAGQRDWSELCGQTLCQSCYACFSRRGTLVRRNRSNLSDLPLMCGNEDCSKLLAREKTTKLVSEGMKAGGQDWSSLLNLTLCNACYLRFRNKGTLDKQGVVAEHGSRSDAESENDACGCRNPAYLFLNIIQRVA